MARRAIDRQPVGAVHFFLLGVSDSPVGGYKVVYEYANALVDLGIETHVWHSTAFYALTAGRGRGVKRVKAAARTAVTRMRFGRQLVRWFDVDPRVRCHLSIGLPRPRLATGDAVVATAIETTTYAATLAARFGARSAALIQHLETWSASRQEIVAAWGQVDARIVIAPWLGEECSRAGLSSVLIPNALDASSFPMGLPLAERESSVLTLLSRHHYKRPDVVVAALTQIHELAPETALIAFGQDARHADLPDYVTFYRQPPPAVLARLYREATVYLCGSDAEGWHLPPAEATLAGAAVVSTDIGGVRASMEDDALYAQPGDSAELGRLAVAILDRPGEYQRGVENARRRLACRTYAENSRDFVAAVFGRKVAAP